MAPGANAKLYSNELSIKAIPNPSATDFTLVLQSPVNERVDMKVMDGIGRVVETRANVSSNSVIKIGAKYRPGIYYVQIIRDNKRVILRLIKGTN